MKQDQALAASGIANLQKQRDTVSEVVAGKMDINTAMKFHVTQLAKLLGLPHKSDADEMPEEQPVEAPEVDKPSAQKVLDVMLSICSGNGETKAGYPKGLDEDDDKEQLTGFFSRIFDFKVDPSQTSWCAYLLCAALIEVGYVVASIGKASTLCDELTKLELTRKLDPGETLEVGDLCFWRNHAAQVAETSPKILVAGGNQSDEGNVTPKDWYDPYSKFIGYFRLV